MKRFRNTQESMMLLDEIIFSGQMTKLVIDKIAENYIKPVKVPAKMTRVFQPLDLTVNGSAKAFMKKRFSEWYSRCVMQELDIGKDVDSIDIQLKMSVLKSLHAWWKIDLYNYLASSEGREIAFNCWKTKGLDPLDLSASIDALSEEVDSIDFAVTLNTKADSFLVSKYDDDDDSEDDDDNTWVDKNEEPINNIFDIMNDM